MRSRCLRAVAAIAAGSVGAGAPAIAGTTPTNLTVNATVTASCTATSAAVGFGAVNTLSATADDATGSITVTCTNGTAWSASAGVGTGTGATFATRKLVSGANLMNYTLYTDSARTIVWGDGVAPTGLISGTGNGSAQTSTIYGRIPGSQGTVAPGSYADTVAVTITF